ncbi:AsmA family protein [Agrobacterium vitis]|uniref:AsmA family protein n=1 Tax=Agrobacterium vitis TaxID=373 RepID=UPI0012E70097|nr:AsmA family protein [Agrobacterium vitis]
MLGRLFIAFGGLVVVALFAALLAPLFVNWTDFRKDFEDQASRLLGKKVVVHGAVEARILPFPSITMNDVTVGPGTDGKTLAHVARFSMDAELAPFLSGEARIFAMRIEQPNVRLRLLPDGSLDWLQGSQPSLPGRNVVLEKVTVVDGALTLVDQQTGRTRQVSGLNADMTARSLAGPWTVLGQGVLDGQSGNFSLSSLQPDPAKGAVPVKIHIAPDATPVDIDLSGDLALVDKRPTLQGSFLAALRANAEDGQVSAPMGNPVLPPRIKGKFELANDRVRIPEYRMEIGASDQPYIITGEATLDSGKAPEFLLTAEGQQIDVDKLTPTLPKGKTGRQMQNSARQRIQSLIALADRIPIPAMPGRASLKLPAIVAGDTVIRDITLDLRPAGTGWQVDKAVATLPGRTQAEAAGRLQLKGQASFNGSLLVASSQPSGLASWLSGDVDPAIRQLRTAGFSANVNLTSDLQRFEKLELAIGPASLHGRLERQSADGVMPSLSFDLSGNAFDFDATKALASLVSGDASDDALLSHQIAGNIKVDAFSAFGITARDVDGLFTYKDGGFSVRKLDIGNLAGASIKATGEATGSLADYSGKAQVMLHASDISGFLAMLHQQLPQHPLLARLAPSGQWYSDADIVVNTRFGDAQYGGLQVDLQGKANGTAVDATYRQDSLFDVFDDSEKSFSLTAANGEPSALLGQLGLDPLPVPMDGGAKLTLQLKQQGTAPAQGQMSLTSGATRLGVSGTVNLGADLFLQGKGKVELASDDIAPLLIMNAVSLPGIDTGLPMSLTSEIERQGDNKTQLRDIKGAVAGDGLSGTLVLEPTASAVKIGGAVVLDTLDLEWLASTVIGPVKDPASDTLSAVKVQTPVWGDMQMDIALKSGTLDLGPLPAARDVAARLTLVDGGMALEDLSGTLFGGALSGRMSLANNQGTAFLRSRVSLANADLGKIWPDSGLSGQARLQVMAEGSGSSAQGLLGSVNGSGQVDLSALTIPDLDLSSFPALSAAFGGATSEVTPEQVSAALTPLLARAPARLGDVTMPFTLSDGKARMQGVKVPAKDAAIETQAVVTVASGDVDANVQIAFDPATAVSTPGEAGVVQTGVEQATAGDAAPTVHLLLNGPLAAPKRQLDVREMASYLSLQAFERERRRVETLQAAVLEKQRLRREVAYYTALAAERAAAQAKAAAVADAAARAAEAAARAADRGAGNAAPSTPRDGPNNGFKLELQDLPGVQ